MEAIPADFEALAAHFPEGYDRTAQRVARYWHERCEDALPPARASIDIAEIRFALANIDLVQVEAAGTDFIYRVSSSTYYDRSGRHNLTSKSVDHIPEPELAQLVRKTFTHVVTKRVPVFGRLNQGMGKRLLNYDFFVLPLSNDRTKIDMLLCGHWHK